MDLQVEASDASRNEVEVGGGVSEEKLGKQLQVVSIGNQECGDLKETLKDSQVSDITCQSEQPTMGSGESKCGVQTNGESLVNGVSEEGAASGADPNVTISSKEFSVTEGTREQEVSHNEKEEEDTNFKVTELINEILHQSSYLDDRNLNGLEFADTLPEEIDAADLDLAVKSSSHVLYLNHREENGSSPDSDSNMTTASEGSSTPTSELSSTSIHSSDQQNFLNTQDARVLTQLICSNNLADPDCRLEDKLSNECNPKLLLEVSVPDCINDLDTLSVKEAILESNDSSILVMELIGDTAVPQKSSENGSLKGIQDTESSEIEDGVNFDVGKVHPDIDNTSAEANKQSNENLTIIQKKSEIELTNTHLKGPVGELESDGGFDIGKTTEDMKIAEITVKAVIQTFSETADLSENISVVSENICTQVTNSEKVVAEALDHTEVTSVISLETRDEGKTMASAEMEAESTSSSEEINEMSQSDLISSVNLEVFDDQLSASMSAIISNEGKDFENESESVEMAKICHDPELDEEEKEEVLHNETDNQGTSESITTGSEESMEKNDIIEAVAALESLSLTLGEPEKSIERVEIFSAVSSRAGNASVIIEQSNEMNNECDVRVESQVEEAHESTEVSGEMKAIITSNKKGKEENSASEYDCACRRNETTEEGGNVMVGVWAELRSSLRQLHRSMIPQSSQVLIQRSRPSINRIKALANMLVSHDAHQLYLRISHLAHELCIELKVRLLATIHDSPTSKESTAFIQGICDSYQWVMSVCEALHPALERLDSEHLSRFKLNWVTVNMHVFHSTILTDPDVHDYAQICKEKLKETPEGEDVLSCLASLHRTLAVAEAVWVRADTLLQEYAIERAALSARRRQLLADWEQFKAQQRTQQQQEAAKAGVPNLVSTSATISEDGGAQCPCDDCVNGRTGQMEGQGLSNNARIALSSTPDVRSPSSCECHFCNASMAAATTEEPVLPPSSGSSLPPLAQPQLSLYPHIHNTPPGSDIVGTGQSREELGPIPPAPTTKPPITTNPYLGSDLLTEQLMREWELVYGDALTPPGSHPILPPPPDAAIQHYEGDPSSLVSGVETMRISSSRPSYTRAMVDPSLPYVPDSCTTARAHTTILPSSQPSANAADHTVSSAHSVAKVPVSSRSSTPSCEGSVSTIIPDVITASGKSCCSTSNTTSVITHTHAHHTHTTATAQKGKCLGKVEEIRKRQLERADTSTSRESVGESETSGGDEWSSGDESDSSTTVSSTHQDPHCDCCYCHMLHHKQGGGRQKYSDRRERLLKILSRKKNARNAVCPNSAAANAVAAASESAEIPTSTGGTPLGGQNIDKIMDYIEGNQTDEAKRAKKAAKKARQRQKKLALKREKKEEEKTKVETKKGECEEEEEEVEDGPLAELRRRAPDVTITVVRPGQQTSRTTSSPQMAFQRPRDPSPPAMEVYKPPQAKLVPSLAQSSEELSSQSQSSSRTILHPSRHSTQGRQPQPQPGKHFAAAAPSFSNRESAERAMAGGGEPGGLSNILKAMDTSGKEKDKGSQMVTIRRVMDPNSAEPTVTITLKGEQPEKDKVLFKLINGQAVAGNGGSGNGGKKGSKSQKNSKSQAQSHSKVQPKPQPQPQPVEPIVPEGLDPEELRKLKKRQKKERQRLKRQQEQMQEQEKGQLQQLEIQKQQEFLRQQQEQIHQQQLALQRQQEQLIKQQHQQQQTQNSNLKKNKNKKNKGGKNVTSSNKSNNNKSNGNKGNSNNGVSALVYDGDNMAQSFNLPPGVTINKVAGQPGMVTISNNMGGAFSQPFLPNPNIYPSPVVQGFPVSVAKNSQLPNSYNSGHTPSLSWNSAIDKAGSYPDKDNVIVVDTNNSFLGANSSANSKTAEPEVSSEEKVMMAVKGLIEPSSLTASQRKKYKKMKRAMQEEEEEERQKQKEEDDLMDQMYNLASGNWTKINEDKTNHTQGKNQSKKNQKQKENNKKQASQTNHNKQNSQQTAKNSKQQIESHQQKQKQNNKNNNKQGSKDNTLQNITNQPKKESVSSTREKGKQHSQQEENRQSTQQKQGQKKTTEHQQKKTQQQQKVAQQQKHSHQQEKQMHHQQNQSQKQQQKNDQKQQQKGKQNLASQEKHGVSNNQKVDPNGIGNYPKRIGYDPQDIAHEARYAQYLAANANTLAKMNYSTYNGSIAGEQGQDQYLVTEEEKLITKKKMKKKGKKGHLEDMTIDSVFTPKDVAEGELDETERDVEAFKRFCFNNVPRHSGEKPKVNFNVKDIMIKKRPCNGNL
ncbi:uncharacterized protein LOC122262074 isoform X2 [Penaeus japonicus]|uniref:uncharacterized protein LOC122262074 isoform X2 n=1 Tax=Penaeus japonicus TaxID=27405 RepID=UPI001C716207|nr:uncharacterized protein LOC122262074 isoform X2 [Penaeus japonicus]